MYIQMKLIIMLQSDLHCFISNLHH